MNYAETLGVKAKAVESAIATAAPQVKNNALAAIADALLARQEKILAAKRAGISEIILSEDNAKDIAEIKEDYVEGLKFHFVRTNEEVLELALEK